MASVEREPIMVVWGGGGRAPCGVEDEGTKPPPPVEMKIFVYCHSKEGSKVNDLSYSSLPCPRQTVSLTHDQPLL